MYVRHVDSSTLDFSLSSNRPSFIVLSLALAFSIHHKQYTESKSRQYPHQGCSFTYYTQYWWGVYHFKNTYSPITLGNISSINLVSIFRCSSSPNNPVYPRCVDFSDLVFSLSSDPSNDTCARILSWYEWCTEHLTLCVTDIGLICGRRGRYLERWYVSAETVGSGWKR